MFRSEQKPNIKKRGQSLIDFLAFSRLSAVFMFILDVLRLSQTKTRSLAAPIPKLLAPRGRSVFGKAKLLKSYKRPPTGRSGETRTLGLMLPKHARYQLRHTPAAVVNYTIQRC